MRFKINPTNHLYHSEGAPEGFSGEVVTLDEVEALERKLKAVKDALAELLPTSVDGTCFYCDMGNLVDEDGRHFDRDNMWDENPRCLDHERYAKARAALAQLDAESAQPEQV